MQPVWGIDLGGTKIEGVILKDSESVEVLHRLREPTQREKGYDHIINQVQLVINRLSAASGMKPERIGIGTPGTISPRTGLMKNSNTTCLNDRPFRADIERQLGIPVKMANDANCFAVAEANLGAVRDHVPDAQLVFGVILGTGVGGGLVINKKVWNGGQGIGGEWGHTFLDESGGPCYCGDVGCTEMIIAGPALERYYEKISGNRLSLKEITARHMAQNDPHATETMERLLHFFAKGISNVINILDPDAIVLGGGVGNIDLLYTEGVKRIEPFIFNKTVETPFLKPKLGDSAGVFGAALLVA
ncbi:MAG: ROK family protein [Saprospiraceae bacterium]|nr:ROK family protein [Saprospiraceae bacterium]